VLDYVRADELRAQADRLNPDMWVTDEEVLHGLEQYEAVFASLREVVGRKRRRRRRGGRHPQPATPDTQAAAVPEPDTDESTADE
jgi:hypothetical protein